MAQSSGQGMDRLQFWFQICHEAFGKNPSMPLLIFSSFNHNQLPYNVFDPRKDTSLLQSPLPCVEAHIRNFVLRSEPSCKVGDVTFFFNLSTLLRCPEPSRGVQHLPQLYFGPHGYYLRGKTASEKDFFLLFQLPVCPVPLQKGGNCTYAIILCCWVCFVFAVCILILGDCNRLCVGAECGKAPVLKRLQFSEHNTTKELATKSNIGREE